MWLQLQNLLRLHRRHLTARRESSSGPKAPTAIVTSRDRSAPRAAGLSRGPDGGYAQAQGRNRRDIMTRLSIALGGLVAGALALTLIAPPAAAHAKRKHRAAAVVAAPAAATPTETAEQQRVRLNAEQAATAQAQNARNAANKAAYEAAVAARDAEIARQKAEYDAAMVKWKADTAACQAGDMARCGKPVS